MPLLDHFHPPLATRRPWSSFLARWAATMAEVLNVGLLPAGYFAEVRSRYPATHSDVFVPDDDEPAGLAARDGGLNWSPPAPDLTLPACVPDEIEVQVYSEEEPDPVAAVEVVGPGNKDRDEARRAFAARCDVHLQHRAGLVIVDIVTEGRRNLHDQLMRFRGHDESALFPGTPSVYASAYRPVRRKSVEQVDVRLAPLAVGSALPTLPLALRGGQILPLDLEVTYMEVRRRSRLG